MPEKKPAERVFICIRLKPQDGIPKEEQMKQFQENLNRAKRVARYAVLHGFDPEATTIYYTQFLDDFSTEERRIGVQLGRERIRLCQRLWWIKNDGDYPLYAASGKYGDRKFAEECGAIIETKDYREIEKWLQEFDASKKNTPI